MTQRTVAGCEAFAGNNSNLNACSLNTTPPLLLSKDIGRGRHCVFALHVHLVFVTKHRGKVFDGDAIQRLKVIFDKVCTDFEAQLVDIKQYVEQQNTPL